MQDQAVALDAGLSGGTLGCRIGVPAPDAHAATISSSCGERQLRKLAQPERSNFEALFARLELAAGDLAHVGNEHGALALG